MGPQTDPSALAMEVCTWVICFLSLPSLERMIIPFLAPPELFCWKRTEQLHVGLYGCSVKCDSVLWLALCAEGTRGL